MCNSRAEGGQRCPSGARKTLASKQAKKVAAEVAYTDAVAAGAPAAERADLLRKGLVAEHEYEDALAHYASTEEGRADLTARLATAPAYHTHRVGERLDPNRPDDVATLKIALYEGEHLARQAAEIKRAVRAGELTPEEGERRSVYPNEFYAARRASQIDNTVARVIPEAAATVRDTARYRDLFDQRIALQNTIHIRSESIEDSADAHAVEELHQQLDAVNAEMEALETWRRNPTPQAAPGAAQSPGSATAFERLVVRDKNGKITAVRRPEPDCGAASV